MVDGGSWLNNVIIVSSVDLQPDKGSLGQQVA